LAEKRLKVLIALYHKLSPWNLPESMVASLRNEFASVDIERADSQEELERRIEEVDILFGWRLPREVFLRARRLKWVHVAAAGVGGSLHKEIIDSPMILTNCQGIHSIPAAEHAMGLILSLLRKLPLAVKYQIRGEWGTEGMLEGVHQFDELYGKTMGIIGLGSIGREIAKRANCFGMRVIATRRHSLRELPEGVDQLLPPEELPLLLKGADWVVISVPLTSRTRGLIGKGELALMKRSAYLVNISRGKIIQEKALIKALEEGKIAGAALDVFEEEPLPQGSPLYGMDNVIITPHIAGLSRYYFERALDIFRSNLSKYIKGEPLINVVDKKEGY